MVSAQSLVGIAVAIAIAAIVITGVALPILAATNTTGWTSMNTTIFSFISTFLILSLMIGAIAGTGLVNLG